MKRKPIDTESASISRLRKIITDRPGLTSMELAQAAAYSYSHVKNALSVLSKAQIALPVPRGIDRCWYLAEQAKPLLEQWDRTRRKRGVVKDKPPTKRDRIHAMSKEPGGVSMAQIMAALDLQLNDGGRHTMMMVRQGRLYRGVRQGARLRWFDRPERAAEWEALPPMEPSEWSEPRRKAWAEAPKRQTREEIRKANRLARLEAQKQRRAEKVQLRAVVTKAKPEFVIKAKPANPAPVEIRTKPSDIRGSVDYSRAKVIVCPAPTHDARYQVAPGAVIQGEFSRQWQQLRGAA